MSEEKLSVRLEAEAMVLRKQTELIRPNSIKHRELTHTIALLTEAAQLARRVEEAPATNLATCHTDDGIELTAQVPADAPGTWCSGQRVRLVRES